MRYQSWRSKAFVALAITALLGACAALRSGQEGAKKDRGIKFSHAFHISEPLLLACADCHDTSSGEPATPGHDLCSLCHEINEDPLDVENCALCHSDPAWFIKPYEKLLDEEVIFSHAPHFAAEVDCSACHTNPDKGVLPKGGLMQRCMDCHESAGGGERDLNACAVCHKVLRADVVPKFRGGIRIAHDAPVVWERIHGQEARMDEAFCYICHDTGEAFCADCHQKNPPDDHTLSWRRRTHGLEAAWNREKCAACHEEDSCLKCHQNTKPTSHRGSFLRGMQTHCVQCHFPERDTGCAVCHQNIEHPSARRSPHALGVFPADCARCHPGAIPDQAPHFSNSTVRCTQCHN